MGGTSLERKKVTKKKTVFNNFFFLASLGLRGEKKGRRRYGLFKLMRADGGYKNHVNVCRATECVARGRGLNDRSSTK